MAKVRAHIIIEGVVQGVCFRANTKTQADINFIYGWVSNKHDGTVEAVFEGEAQSVNKVIEWCRNGPTEAIVKNVNVSWETCKNEFKNFSVI